MSWRVTQENILSLSADAAALSVELSLAPGPSPVCQALARAGGTSLRSALCPSRTSSRSPRRSG